MQHEYAKLCLLFAFLTLTSQSARFGNHMSIGIALVIKGIPLQFQSNFMLYIGMCSNFQATEWNKVSKIKSRSSAHLQICHHAIVPPRCPYVRDLSNNSQSNLFGHKLSIGSHYSYSSVNNSKEISTFLLEF